MKKIIIITWMFLCSFLFLGVNAQAYIDPSVMTYVIQAVAGVVVAAGAGIGFYYRKARKKLHEKIGTDENKHKEVESDEV